MKCFTSANPSVGIVILQKGQQGQILIPGNKSSKKMLSNNPDIYLIERENPLIIFCEAIQAIYDNGSYYYDTSNVKLLSMDELYI